MKSRLTILVVVLAVTVGCTSMQVHVDHDRSADLDGYKTFMWSEPSESSLEDTAPLMHTRIKNAIERELRAGGLETVSSNPDLYVTYYTDENDELRLDTTHLGYGFGPSWYWDPYWPWAGAGMASSRTTVRSYTRGTLIVDLWDAKQKRLVWRGTAEDVVPENPERAAAKIDQAVAKMATEFRKMSESG